MKLLLHCLCTIIICTALQAQNSLQFDPGDRAIKIPFQLINNLIFIGIEVNDVPLTFLLDSGVEETILFSLDDAQDVTFTDVEKIKLRGLGSESYIECYKSSYNRLDIGGLTALNQEIYIILDQNFNFSSHIGIPVNGIIGYNFFKDNLVEIDYDKKRIVISRNNKKQLKKAAKDFTPIPISVEAQKPYVVTSLMLNQKQLSAKVLVDIGNSDAVWLFDSRSTEFVIPENNVADFLGHGFSGEIQGKRARIESFRLADFAFSNPIAAFPDSSSIKNMKLVENRVGSLGGEILRRFNLIIDYKNEKLYLRKGSHFDDPFRYDMSGITLQHNGLQWIQKQVGSNNTEIMLTYDAGGSRKRSSSYKFELKPVYRITDIRTDSPADLAGIRANDILHSLNGRSAFNYSLQQISALLRSDEGRIITVEVERDNKIIKVRFTLKSLL